VEYEGRVADADPTLGRFVHERFASRPECSCALRRREIDEVFAVKLLNPLFGIT
jgi:hypothetical protein